MFLTTTDGDMHEQFVDMKYKDLCKHLNDKQYMPCVRSVYERLWEVMHSHWLMMKYHKEYDQAEHKVMQHTSVYLGRPGCAVRTATRCKGCDMLLGLPCAVMTMFAHCTRMC